jgi:hypothetical protein
MFASSPYTISFGGGIATYTFTDIAGASADPLTVDAVSTGGDGLVNSFLGPVAFQNGTVVGATGYRFSAVPAPAAVPDSVAEASIGLKFSLNDGVHYGYVTTLGPEVVQYGYNSIPRGLIAIPVPEPETWVMLTLGFGCLGAITQLKKSKSTKVTTGLDENVF